MKSKDRNDIETEFETAGQQKPMSLPMEFFCFIRENKAWWLAPILILLGLIGLVAAFGSPGGVPWIYTFF